jgi:hypothetical protein
MFGWLAHKSSKKKIEQNTAWYREKRPDQRANILFWIWATRGIDLAPGTSLFAFHYLKGAESPLTDYIKILGGSDPAIDAAIHHHFFTNLAVTYPDEGYRPLVRTLWDEVFANISELREIASENAMAISQHPFSEWIENDQISQDEFLDDPKVIMPHFFVPGHPLSVQLLENGKISSSILGT